MLLNRKGSFISSNSQVNSNNKNVIPLRINIKNLVLLMLIINNSKKRHKMNNNNNINSIKILKNKQKIKVYLTTISSEQSGNIKINQQ